MTEPSTTLSLQLSQKDIEGVINASIQAQVTTAMKANGDIIIAQYVSRLLNENVDREGKPTSSTYDSRPFLKWLSDKTIREACQTAVQEWMAENKPAVIKAVKAALTKDRDKLAKQAAETLLSSGAYGLTIQLDVAKRERSL